MALNRETVLAYAEQIPGLAAKDNLITALYRGHDSLATERCQLLLSNYSTIPNAGARQQKMLRRLLTMIRLVEPMPPTPTTARARFR